MGSGFAFLMNKIVKDNRDLLRKRKFLQKDRLKSFKVKHAIREVEIKKFEMKRRIEKLLHHNHVVRFWRRVVLLTITSLIVILMMWLLHG